MSYRKSKEVMKITFLGTGSAFTMKNNQTNLLVTQNGKNLLIDAGGDVRFSLAKINLSYKDIDSIYITHQHTDHCGGIEGIAFCSYFDKSLTEKIGLIGNSELIRELWDSSLKGGLKSIQGKKTTLSDYFDIQMVKKNGKFNWEDMEFHIVQSVHIMDEYSIVPSFGLMFKDPKSNKKIYYPGDTQFCPNQIRDFYKEADLIIHDCETAKFHSGVHAHFEDLITLPKEFKEKMMLVHYQDNVLTDSKEWNSKAEEAGFPIWGERVGFVKQGFVLDLEK